MPKNKPTQGDKKTVKIVKYCKKKKICKNC